jgi:hypothetical protein
VYLLLLQGHTQRTGTHGEMISSNLHRAKSLDVIDIAMIPVTYEPMESVLVVVAGPHPTNRYTWGDD